MNGTSNYHSPAIHGLDGAESNQLVHAGTEWVWEQFYVAYINGFVVADTIVMAIA
jgi:hypothetical protein